MARPYGWQRKCILLLLFLWAMITCQAAPPTVLPPTIMAPVTAVMSSTVVTPTTDTRAPTLAPTPAPTLAPPPAGTAAPAITEKPAAVLPTKPSPTLPPTPTPDNLPQIIGASYEGRPIYSYRFGSGPIPIVFVGGIHGGYEWNTILLAYQAMDYFTAQPSRIPANVTLFIIPVANPDGLFAVTQKEGDFAVTDLAEDTFPGRFNGRNVDLNRNWDCQWSATAVWRNQPVSGGSQPFSEPESRALRHFFLEKRPALVLFWHSAANGVFAAGCPETDGLSRQLATIFGSASGYPVYERFAYYPVTGDAGDWLSTQGIPSISIELKTHEALDWEENLAGMLALLAHYNKQLQ